MKLNNEKIAKFSNGLNDHQKFCYFAVAPTGVIKIGESGDTAARMKQLGTTLLFKKRGGRALEQSILKSFYEFNIEGEWFENKGALKAWIAVEQERAGDEQVIDCDDDCLECAAYQLICLERELTESIENSYQKLLSQR